MALAAPGAALAADDCPNAAVRAQQGVQHLPLCMAYEKLTPNNKNGAMVAAEYLFNDDGTETWFNANTSITEGTVSGNSQTILASRGSAGWNLEPLTTTPLFGALRTTGPTDALNLNGVQGMRRILFQSPVPFDPRDVAGGTGMSTADLYMREPDGSIRWLTQPEGFTYTTHQPASSALTFYGASPELSTALFATSRVLNPVIDAAEHRHLWIWRDGKPYEMIDYLPDGSVSTTTRDTVGSAGGLTPIPWMSSDFGTVVWETSVRSGRTEVLTPYVRVDIGTPQARTLLLAASADGTPCAASPGRFDGMTRDGRYVWFSCNSKLTDDAPANGGRYVRDTRTGTVIYEPTRVDRGPTTDDKDEGWTRPDGTFRMEPRDGDLWSINLRTGDETCATCAAWVDGRGPEPSFLGGYSWAGGGLGSSRANSITPEGHVFFLSKLQLVPEDTNAFEDLYLSVDGKVYLLSGGQAPQKIEMGGISPDGSTASFVTSSSLLAEDRDGGVRDVYVLRRNGGFYRESQAPPCSVGCQGPASPPAAVAAPLSIGFTDAGNLTDADDDGEPIAVSGSRSVRGTSLKVKVRTPGAGRITVSGSGLRKTTKSLKKASSATLTVKLSARSQRTLRRKGTVKTMATVRFVPSDGTSQSTRVKLTFRKKATKKKQGSSRSVAAAPSGKAAR